MRRAIVAAVWFLPTVALAYVTVFVTFWFGGFMLTDGLRPPPAPPSLALPPFPKAVDAVLILLGPCALAGGAVLACSRWWVGVAGGIGLGAVSGALLYLSVGHRVEAPVLAVVGWVGAGLLGAAVALCRYLLQGGSRTDPSGPQHDAEPGAAPDPAT